MSEKIRLQEFADEEKQKWRYHLSNRCLFGTDWKERTTQACKMNMMVHGDGSSGIFKHDGFVDIPGKIEEGQFEICLTNPPFGAVETDPDILNKYALGAGRQSQDRAVLALERALRLVKPGGYVGIVIIDGVLNTSSRKYVRDYLKKHAWIHGVISLNKDTFAGYGSRAKTSVLFMQRKEQEDHQAKQKPVFMAIARNTGLAPNGQQIPGNVLPDILLDFQAFRRGEEVPGQHDESWVCEVKDRLDAEFYATTPVTSVDIDLVRQNVEKVLGDIQIDYVSLANMERFFAQLRTNPVRLCDILKQVHAKEKLEPNKIYRSLGVRWWGGGVFLREEKSGREIKAAVLYRVSQGWIIYNRLFAFRGSFAIVPEEFDGYYVSGEFPTFETKEGVPESELLKRFIIHSLNSPQYLALVDAQSTGSTKQSRNRFKEDAFLDTFIEVPESTDDLSRAVEYLDLASKLRTQQELMLASVKSLRDGVHLLLPNPSQD